MEDIQQIQFTLRELQLMAIQEKNGKEYYHQKADIGDIVEKSLQG